nr:hypothetical protein [Parabacteroides provencensis]
MRPRRSVKFRAGTDLLEKVNVK